MNWTFLLISVWVAITIFYYWRMGRVLFPKSRFPFREIYLQDSDEQRETEKRATVRGSKEPLRGDDAESEQQRRERVGR